MELTSTIALKEKKEKKVQKESAFDRFITRVGKKLFGNQKNIFRY